MKAIVLKKDLVSYRKRFLIVKPSKKIAENAQVTISASEKLSIASPGFRQDMACETTQWGTVSLPYKLWHHLIEKLLPVIRKKEISISGQPCQFEFCGTTMDNPRVRVTRLDRSVLEIPGDAKPMEIVIFALQQDLRHLQDSVSWKIIEPAVDKVRDQMKRACAPLKKYKITHRDIAMLVAIRLGIDDKKRFVQMLFP